LYRAFGGRDKSIVHHRIIRKKPATHGLGLLARLIGGKRRPANGWGEKTVKKQRVALENKVCCRGAFVARRGI